MLVFKRHYSGPYEVLIDSYAGNVAVSFAVYFIAVLQSILLDADLSVDELREQL